MDLQERINLLIDAQEKLHEAKDLITEAVEDSSCEANTKAYLTDQLEILTSSDHCWLSNNLNVDKIIEKLREEFTEEVEN